MKEKNKTTWNVIPEEIVEKNLKYKLEGPANFNVHSEFSYVSGCAIPQTGEELKHLALNEAADSIEINVYFDNSGSMSQSFNSYFLKVLSTARAQNDFAWITINVITFDSEGNIASKTPVKKSRTNGQVRNIIKGLPPGIIKIEKDS